jgi:hypothetical protein
MTGIQARSHHFVIIWCLIVATASGGRGALVVGALAFAAAAMMLYSAFNWPGIDLHPSLHAISLRTVCRIHQPTLD